MQLVVCKWESVFTCSGPYWSCLFRLVSPFRGRRGTSWQNWRRFCHIFLEQSVSLSDWSTHSCNTRLLVWQQCLDQSDKSCEEVLSKFKQYFQTKLMLHQMLPTFIATWGYTKKDFSNCYWERSKNDHKVCVWPLIIFENRDSWYLIDMGILYGYDKY